MLPSSYRLPSQEIADILRRGERIRKEGIDIAYKKVTRLSRFAFIISARIDKRATARNRMKRLVREAVHHLLPIFVTGIDGIVMVRGKLPDTEIETRKIIRGMLEKAGVLV